MPYLTNCPTCGDPVRNNHRCRGATLEAPTPRPAEFWAWVENAKAEAQAKAAAPTIELLTLPLEEPTP